MGDSFKVQDETKCVAVPVSGKPMIDPVTAVLQKNRCSIDQQKASIGEVNGSEGTAAWAESPSN